MNLDELNEVLNNFNLEGDVVKTEFYSNGRINKTILITTQKGTKTKKFILQQINTTLFKDVKGLMDNINAVTEHLKTKINKRKGDCRREALNLIKTRSGENYVKINGECFRLYSFIENSNCFNEASTLDLMRQMGKGFGEFHKDLSDFDSKRLNITIPNFHNTKKRFDSFIASLKADAKGRVSSAKSFIQECVDRAEYKDLIVKNIENGKLPIRVAHNDTKLNNVVFDKSTGELLAVLDLDTVMPDTILYDFGDAVRFACNTASEHETDLDKIKFDIAKFKAYAEGYLCEMGEELTDKEKELLPIAPLVIAYELGLRFLTDYLDGDKYFSINTPTDNLNRAKVQITLLKEMEKNENQMKDIVDDCLEKYSKKYN